MQAIDASENVDFNLHTHVECNSPLLPDSKTIVISTHALTWSATTLKLPDIIMVPFQLTHSRGVRLDDAEQGTEFLRISTHALTWSATTCHKFDAPFV